MNLPTIFVMKLKEKTDLKKHHATVLKKLDGLLKTIDGLREDPIFIDTIHGEQELSLDQTIELFNGIRSHFITTIVLKLKHRVSKLTLLMYHK